MLTGGTEDGTSFHVDDKASVSVSLKIMAMKWSSLTNFDDEFRKRVRGNYPDVFDRLGKLCDTSQDNKLVTSVLMGRVNVAVTSDKAMSTQAGIQVGGNLAGANGNFTVVSDDSTSKSFDSDGEVVLAVVMDAESGTLGSLCQTKSCPEGCAHCDPNSGVCVHCQPRHPARIREGVENLAEFGCPGAGGGSYTARASGQVRTCKVGNGSCNVPDAGQIELMLHSDVEQCRGNTGVCWMHVGHFLNSDPPQGSLQAASGNGRAKLQAFRCDVATANSWTPTEL